MGMKKKEFIKFLIEQWLQWLIPLMYIVVVILSININIPFDLMKILNVMDKTIAIVLIISFVPILLFIIVVIINSFLNVINSLLK